MVIWALVFRCIGLITIVQDRQVLRRVRKIAKSDYIASSYLSLCPFVRPAISPSSAWNSAPTGRIFHKTWGFFENISRNLKSDKNNGYFTWRPIYIFSSYLAEFFLRITNVPDKILEKITTHILCSITIFFKSYRLWDNKEKYCKAGQATDENMAHAHFMLNIWSAKRTLRICDTYCFSTATMVEQTFLSVKLYKHCLFCIVISTSPLHSFLSEILTWPKRMKLILSIAASAIILAN